MNQTEHVDSDVASPMREFYERYYRAVESSRAHAEFCAYAYGQDLAQHGFVTMEQLDALIQVARLESTTRALDLGCGNGLIAEYLSDRTGAHLTGLDYIPSAIASAQARTRAKHERLEFVVGDLNCPRLSGSFDVALSLDTLYFSADYAQTLTCWRALVKTGGAMAIFFSHGANPETPKESFRRETLPPDKTLLGVALKECGLEYQTIDFTRQDYTLAQRKKEILTKLKPDFESEGNLFLFENRWGETLGVLDAIESGMHARYLYLVRVK